MCIRDRYYLFYHFSFFIYLALWHIHPFVHSLLYAWHKSYRQWCKYYQCPYMFPYHREWVATKDALLVDNEIVAHREECRQWLYGWRHSCDRECRAHYWEAERCPQTTHTCLLYTSCSRLAGNGFKWNVYPYKMMWQGGLNEAIDNCVSLDGDGMYMVFLNHI